MKILSIVFALILCGCATTGSQKQSQQSADWSKMNASLKSEVMRSLEENPDKEITVFIQVVEDSDKQATLMDELGFQLTNRIKTIWSGKGTAEVLIKLSRLDSVQRMELNRNVKLHSKS